MRFSCKPKMTSSIYPRQGTLCTILNSGIWRHNKRFLSVFFGNFTPVMHRFRCNDVFLQTWKWRHGDFSVSGHLTKFSLTDSERVTPSFCSCSIDISVYLNRLRVIQPFHFGLGFHYFRRNLWVFREQNDPNNRNFVKHLLRVHFPTTNRVFWAFVLGNRLRGIGCTHG